MTLTSLVRIRAPVLPTVAGALALAATAASLAGCAFRPSGDGGGDLIAPDAGGTVDPIDAATSTPLDGPPPCPDGDQDGVCDAVDDWPCGTRPTVPASVAIGTVITASVSGVSIDGGGNTAVVAAGSQLSYELAWTLRDMNPLCTTCVDQLEVGLVPGRRHTCVFDANPPQNQTMSGTATVPMTAPSTPGLHSLRFQIAQDFSCSAFGRTDWWIAAPGADATFGVLCVR